MKVGSDGRSAPSVVADQTHSISVFKHLEAKSRKFHDVVTCNDSAIIPSFTAYPELRSFDYCGKHSLIHAPTACVYACIEQYLQCKGKDLCNTSACILVPAWEHAKFRDLLTGMTSLQSVQPSEVLPSMPSSSARQDFTKSKFPLEVWYDPCKPVMQCNNIAEETERLLMTFSGKVKQDLTASILIDSGATHNFVDASYAGDTSASVQGYAHVRLNLQSFHGVVKMYTIDLPQDSMILGQVWLKDHQATLDYANQCVRYFMNGRRLSLACQEQSVMTDSCMTIPVLLFTEFKKETRKKCNAMFTVFVHCVQTDDAGGVKSPHGQA